MTREVDSQYRPLRTLRGALYSSFDNRDVLGIVGFAVIVIVLIVFQKTDRYVSPMIGKTIVGTRVCHTFTLMNSIPRFPTS